MAPVKGTSLRWLTLAVLLPLLVLGVLAWLGTRAQVRAAWSSARDEAKATAEFSAKILSRGLEEAVVGTIIFSDPPVPGPSVADEVLDGTDLKVLRSLRDGPPAGLSPAGLPRRVLAAFRAFGKTGAAEDSGALVRLATQDEPSILTAEVFRKVPDLPAGLLESWASDDKARKIFRNHPEIGGAGKWIEENGELWWISSVSGDEVLYYLDPPTIARSINRLRPSPPLWAEVRLYTGERKAGSETEILADVPVDFSSNLSAGGRAVLPFEESGMVRLEIIAARPELFEAAARQQARWTLGLLAFAVAISGGALFFIHRAVERERRLNAMKSDFVASVSHELRAPVASIRLMADALTAGKIELHTVSEFHRLISREGARLTTLIENVLDFARIEQGRKQWHFEECDLALVITETVNLMVPLAAEKSIALVSPKPFPGIVAHVDPGAIQQALVNLLDNAIKFSPAGSEVEIRLTQSSANWEIQINDQGPGIPPAEHARIFEKFHRLGSELRRETQGTGIGLSLVKAVAEAHGGRVALASVPGEGCVFTLIGPIGPILPSPTP